MLLETLCEEVGDTHFTESLRCLASTYLHSFCYRFHSLTLSYTDTFKNRDMYVCTSSPIGIIYVTQGTSSTRVLSSFWLVTTNCFLTVFVRSWWWFWCCALYFGSIFLKNPEFHCSLFPYLDILWIQSCSLLFWHLIFRSACYSFSFSWNHIYGTATLPFNLYSAVSYGVSVGTSALIGKYFLLYFICTDLNASVLNVFRRVGNHSP